MNQIKQKIRYIELRGEIYVSRSDLVTALIKLRDGKLDDYLDTDSLIGSLMQVGNNQNE